MWDIIQMWPVLRLGASRPLTPADLPASKPSFGLGPESAAQIDARAAALRASPRRSKLPLLVRLILDERAALCAKGTAAGLVHGLVNSCGRFLIIRAAIDAVRAD